MVAEAFQGNNILDSVFAVKSEGYEDDEPDGPLLVGDSGAYPYTEGRHIQVIVNIAYGDESGIEAGAPLSMLSGWLGSVATWDSFKEEWGRALDCFEVPAFHGKEFFQRATWQKNDSPYRGWSEERAANYLECLLGIVDNHSMLPIGAVVVNEDFRGLNEDVRRFVTGGRLTLGVNKSKKIFGKWQTPMGPDSPYFASLMIFVHEALRFSDVASRVHFWFDRQMDYEARAHQMFNEIRDANLLVGGEMIGDVTFAISAQSPALQVADMWCYVVNKSLTRWRDGRRAPPDIAIAFDSLIKKRPRIRLLDFDSFKEMVESSNQTVRDAWGMTS